MGRILVVDDEKNITFVLQAILEKAGYEAVVFNDSTDAIAALDRLDGLEAVITDLYMPGPGGMEVLEHCQKAHPELPVVFITAYGTVEAAVSALKRGAFDFITKPFDQTELLNVVAKAVETYRQRQKEPLTIRSPAIPVCAPGAASMAGSSPQLQEVFRMITKAAACPSAVLITGENGTGKELVAFEIHRASSRAGKPFIKSNCAAMPPALLESELFGYERGAFDGASARSTQGPSGNPGLYESLAGHWPAVFHTKPGRFELAHEGTLFLDEITELPLEAQVKLLRALQEGEIERIGGVSTIRVDTRVIVATNKDLQAEVRAGRFREDLFYRLSVLTIPLPPLRERREDIDRLVARLLEGLSQKLGKPVSGVTPEAMAVLRAYSWPGNIRQLENVLERMTLMSDAPVLDVQDLPEELLAMASAEDDSSPASFKALVKRQTQSVERDLIAKALEETHGNVTRAAEQLGLSRKGLQLKMKELRIKKDPITY